MRLTLWRYELRLLGWAAVGGPPLALAAVGLLAVLAQALGNPRQIDRILSESLDVLPVVVGLSTAAAAGGDRALELQLSLAMPFRSTVLRRLALAAAWPALLAAVATCLLAVGRHLVWPVSLGADQFIWLAPLLWLAGLGAAATLGTRAVAAGSALVGVLWVLEQLFSATFSSAAWLQTIWLFLRYVYVTPAAWYANRAVLIALAAVLFGLSFWLLGRCERLLGAES